MAFLIPFLDMGISQSPMISTRPDSWAHWLPGYGATRVLLDGALTSGFDEDMLLSYAVAWLAALLLVTATLWHRASAVPRSPRPQHVLQEWGT